MTVSADVGYWTGSITYQPPYLSSPLIVSFGTGPDANGIAWILEGVDGFDSPDVSGSVIQRSADHGGWPAPQFWAPRSFVIRLFASAPTQALRDYARALLQQVVPVSDLAAFVLNEPVPKFVQFRRSGRVTEIPETLVDVAFTINVVAPDPRKYGVIQHVQPAGGHTAVNYLTIPATVPYVMPNNVAPGSTVILNAGTFEVRPQITILGPITAPSLANNNTGQVVSWSAVTLAAGDKLAVDFDSRTALLNGIYRPADLVSSWWRLDPGQTTVELRGSPSGGTFTTVWRDGYI